MIRTFRTRAGPALAFICVVLAALALAACSSDDGDATVTPSSQARDDLPRGTVNLDPISKPPLSLLDVNGNMFNLQNETEGYITLVYLGYTFCPDICPVELSELAGGLKKLDPAIREKIKVVFITVDPERDTPEALASWLKQFDPSIVGLVPMQSDVSRIARQFGQRPPERTYISQKVYTVSHAAYIAGFTTDNKMRYIFPVGFSPADWKHDLDLLVLHEDTVLP